MAAPNIVGVTTITGKTAAYSLGDTSETTILNNAADSGKVFKVNTIIVPNDDGSNNADITVTYYPQDDAGGTGIDTTVSNNQISIANGEITWQTHLKGHSIPTKEENQNHFHIMCVYLMAALVQILT